jgi:hypothetical protein
MHDCAGGDDLQPNPYDLMSHDTKAIDCAPLMFVFTTKFDQLNGPPMTFRRVFRGGFVHDGSYPRWIGYLSVAPRPPASMSLALSA